MENNALQALTAAAPRPVLQAIEKASLSTGVDFAYLVGKAAAESSFNPKARAKTSSATGLYQFIDKTWLNMVKKYGEKYGLGDYAAKIDDSGRVKNASVRREILALRRDPEKSAMLAAEFAKENKETLDQTWGGDVGATELYLAHFLGAGGAAAFLKARDENPLQTGADIFPQAALSNRNVFYNSKTGQARSLEEIYAFFDHKFEAADGREVVHDSGDFTQIADGLDNTTRDNLARIAADMSAPMDILSENGDSAGKESFVSSSGRRETITWSGPRVRPGAIPSSSGALFAPVDIMLLARLDATGGGRTQEEDNQQSRAGYQMAYND